MRSNYLIMKDKKLILETYSGIVTLENSKQHKFEMAKDPEYSKDFFVLSDLTRAIFDMPNGEADIPNLNINEDALKQNITSVALVHNANQTVYGRIFNRLRSLFPPSHIFSVNLDELLSSIGMVDLRKEVEYNLIFLHDKPKYNWA